MSLTAPEKTLLPFTLEAQKNPRWCWAAVGVSCALYYNPASGWTQCKMASNSIQPSPGNCCSPEASPSCLHDWYLDNPSGQGSLVTAGISKSFVSSAIPFETLKSELDAHRVVPFRMKMGQNGYHFVVVVGYEKVDNTENITVYDPLFDNAEMPYQTFATNYKQVGSVTHTFFTHPPATD